MQRSRRTPMLFVASVAIAALLGSGACSAPPNTSDYTKVDESLKQSFTDGHVAMALGWSCGSLDCHGTIARNLRIYSQYGLRLSKDDRPGGMPTTDHEVDADYRTVTGLEPEIMNQVIADGGQNPERLTLIRKARGTEHHKGGTIMVPGDSLDTCLTTWLSGNVDVNACDAASQPP